MTEARTDTVASAARPRGVEVTAVVVTRGPTEYLADTLTGLAAQARAPQRILVVDAAAQDEHDADHRELAALVDRLRGRSPADVRLLTAPAARTFGHAVRAALASADAVPGPDGTSSGPTVAAGGAPSWLWLLHDDSAPEPTALAELLRAVEGAPSVAVAGCKQRSWAGPVRVLEVGVATSRFGRRMTGLEEPEVDQGQHDGREDVLGVGIAGALVRRDVWDDLGGTDPALGPYGDGLDLSRRARLAGHRVVVVPAAVVRHAQASLARPIGGAVLNRPGWDARRSAQARREAFLHQQLTGVPAPLVPVVTVLAVVSGVVRGLGRFLTKEPHLVVAELVAPWAVLARPGRVLRARRRAAATRRTGRRSLRPLQHTWRDVVRQERDRRLTAAERRRVRVAPSELELSELAALRSRRRGTLAVVVVLAGAVSWLVVGPLVTRVLAGQRLVGGTLAAGDATAGALWDLATQGWVEQGFGHAAPADPLLLVLLPFTALAGDLGRATALLVLGSLVLSAVAAWFAAGAATRSVALRAWAALVWVASPALLLGLGQARLGGVVAHAVLPWVALGVARAVGAARLDVVESGLVGAQRVVASAAGDDVRPVGPRRAEPSLAAAAGAGLAFAVVVAAAPVLLPAGLLALLVVAVPAARRRRLVWVALPALVLQAPVVLDAVSSWGDGGWRRLLADPGRPLGSDAGPLWQQLLGWPVAPPAWVVLPDGLDAVLPWVVTGVVAVVALLALALGGPAGRAVRTGWLVTACGLLAALPARALAVGVSDQPLVDGSAADAAGVLVTPWSGPGTSLALLGLLAAALVGASGVRAAMARHSFGWRQVLVAVVTLVAVAGPAATLAAWTWDVRARHGLALATSDVPVVPAVGVQLQRSPEDVRVLRLDVAPTGDVRATLLRHDGVQLTELARSVTAAEVVGPPLTPSAVEADAADAALADTVARLTSGATGDVAADLAAAGVGAVLVPSPGPDPAPEEEAVVSLVSGRIDATLGMERVTQTASGVIWRIGATDLGTTAAWARLVDPQDGTPVTVPADDGTIDTRVESGPADRLLVLAERADADWTATLDGRPLRSVQEGWRQTFELGPEGGRLVVTHAPAGRVPWLALQGAVLLVTVLLALPVRRRRGGAR